MFMVVVFIIAQNWKQFNIHQLINKLWNYTMECYWAIKKLITDTPNDMEKSQKHHVKSKKTDTKGYIQYDPIYITFIKEQNHKDKKNQMNSCQKVGVKKTFYNWT